MYHSFNFKSFFNFSDLLFLETETSKNLLKNCLLFLIIKKIRKMFNRNLYFEILLLKFSLVMILHKVSLFIFNVWFRFFVLIQMIIVFFVNSKEVRLHVLYLFLTIKNPVRLFVLPVLETYAYKMLDKIGRKVLVNSFWGKSYLATIKK